MGKKMFLRKFLDGLNYMDGMVQYANQTSTGKSYLSNDFGTNWDEKIYTSTIISYAKADMSIGGKYIITWHTSTLMISNDFGVTFTATVISGGIGGVCCDNTGQFMCYFGTTNGIYLSNNYGVSFTQQIPTGRAYKSPGASGNFQYIVSAVQGGLIYVSNDYGNTFIGKGLSKTYLCTAASLSGQYMLAGVYNSVAYVSSDYGTTWVATDISLAQYSCAVSGTGQYMIKGGISYIRLSSDYGVTWVNKCINANYWYDMAIGGDGKYMLASQSISAQLWQSVDYGETWTQILQTAVWRGVRINRISGIGPPGIVNQDIYDYTLNSDGFYNNIYDIQESGYRFRSSFAEVSYTTDFTTLEVTWHTKSYNVPPAYLNVYIDNFFYQTITPNVSEYTTKSILLPNGVKNVTIRQGATYVSVLQGFDITNVKLTGGTYSNVYVPARKNNRMVTASDSIGVGSGTTNNGLKGWQTLLRGEMPTWEFASIGAAGATSLLVQNATDAQRVVDYLAGATNKILWWSLGANDFNDNPVTWKTNLENWLDSIHALDSTIKVVLQTMIYRENYETQLDVLRQKERDIASTRSWCTVVEAQNWIPLNEYYPDSLLVHPNDTGNVTYSQRVKENILIL